MAKHKKAFKGRVIKENEHRINHFIEAPELRLVGENVEPGVYSLADARALAEQEGLDLVEISPNGIPPVARIIDYNKFLYDKKKKEKEIKQNTVKSELKEIRFGPNTDDHDFEFKLKHAEKFLTDGDKVKAYVQFRGRAIVFSDRGTLLLLKFADRLSEIAAVEGMPKLEGKRMHIMLSPKKKKVQ